MPSAPIMCTLYITVLSSSTTILLPVVNNASVGVASVVSIDITKLSCCANTTLDTFTYLLTLGSCTLSSTYVVEASPAILGM